MLSLGRLGLFNIMVVKGKLEVETDRGRVCKTLSVNVSKLTYLTSKFFLRTVTGGVLGKENMVTSSLWPPVKVWSKTVMDSNPASVRCEGRLRGADHHSFCCNNPRLWLL